MKTRTLYAAICFVIFSYNAGPSIAQEDDETTQADVDTTQAEADTTAVADSTKKADDEKLKHRSFIYSIGTNFDFIDNIKADKSYHDLSVNLPGIGNSRWGLAFRLNRYRTFSSEDTITDQFRMTDGSYIFSETDTTFQLNYITNEMTQTTARKLDNIGILVAPSLRLFPLASPSDEFDLSAFVSFEWQRNTQITTISRTFEQTVTDTVPDSWPVPYNTVNMLPPAESKLRSTVDNFFYGVGFKLAFTNDIGILQLSTSLGNAKINEFEQGSENGQLRIVLKQRTWYGIKAEIIEPYETGIKIGCELRGFAGLDAEDPWNDRARFNLYIAKEFNLKKIGELIKP